MAESRPKRWAKAISDCQTALSDLQNALNSLKDVQEEYSEWRDNLPENLQSGNLADKLEQVVELDIESTIDSCDEIESALSDFESADLPLGFGRD
jgi:hypothetical protein